MLVHCFRKEWLTEDKVNNELSETLYRFLMQCLWIRIFCSQRGFFIHTIRPHEGTYRGLMLRFNSSFVLSSGEEEHPDFPFKNRKQ